MSRIDRLIEEGQVFDFTNNSYRVSHGIYTRPSDDLLSWIAVVEDFIRNNYGEESSAYKLYETFDRNKLNGYEKRDFDTEMLKLFGALKACRNIAIVSRKKIEDPQVIQLLKNPFFWAVIIPLVGGSFFLGQHFGSARFDREKSEFYEQAIKLAPKVEGLEKANTAKDSLIERLQNSIALYRDSIRLLKAGSIP